MKGKFYNKKEISKKTGNEYNILVVELSNKIGSIQIMDFGNETPLETEIENITLEKNDKGFWVIKELDYGIPYKYNLAINILMRGEENGKI